MLYSGAVPVAMALVTDLHASRVRTAHGELIYGRWTMDKGGCLLPMVPSSTVHRPPSTVHRL